MTGHLAEIRPNTRGAIAEVLASAHLMLNGYEVYSSIDPTASCDLIALRNGVIKRVEVKSVDSKGRPWMYAPKIREGQGDGGKSDMILVVDLHTRRVYRNPKFESPRWRRPIRAGVLDAACAARWPDGYTNEQRAALSLEMSGCGPAA